VALVRTTATMMNPAITDPATTGRVVGTIGPADLEPGMGASLAGPCKTVSVNRTGAVKRLARCEQSKRSLRASSACSALCQGRDYCPEIDHFVMAITAAEAMVRHISPRQMA
jgi:hypothetical protein